MTTAKKTTTRKAKTTRKKSTTTRKPRTVTVQKKELPAHPMVQELLEAVDSERVQSQ